MRQFIQLDRLFAASFQCPESATMFAYLITNRLVWVFFSICLQHITSL